MLTLFWLRSNGGTAINQIVGGRTRRRCVASTTVRRCHRPPVIFDSIPSQVADMMIVIRGWTNFILIPYFYPEGRWPIRRRPFDSEVRDFRSPDRRLGSEAQIRGCCDRLRTLRSQSRKSAPGGRGTPENA